MRRDSLASDESPVNDLGSVYESVYKRDAEGPSQDRKGPVTW
jgi:hypothetical protein